MISVLWLRKKRWKVAGIFFSFPLIFWLSYYLDGAYESYVPREQELLLSKTSHVPLLEVSGFFLKDTKEPHVKTLYAIGDHEARLTVMTLNTLTEEFVGTEYIDFSMPLLDVLSPCTSLQIASCRKLAKTLTSQWEAIAVDGDHQIFLLHEEYGTVFTFDPVQRKIVSVINLDRFTVNPARSEGPQKNAQVPASENALGEGLILMRQGHMLVARERFKGAAILEYAPVGQKALGYTRGTKLGSTEAFALDKRTLKHTLEPVQEWILPKEYKACDLSEISTDEDGRLYLLSQECQFIAKLEDLTPDDPQIVFEQRWSLPRKIKHGEALAVLDRGQRFLVGDDKRSLKNHNLYVLHGEPFVVSVNL